ncbi:unnamed protein product [Durusdinium trenchii]|uniref:Glutathione S-transferase 3 (GST-III) n=2 Tax=Durusdinium trenchii TaxID=1381693 RepID=A0ABP0QYK2_9DINO
MAALPLEVTLYHYPRTRSTRVLWLLHELGDKVNVTCKRVELMKGEAYSPEFMKMNPNHALPVLLYKDASGEDQAVFESCGIVEFLTEALAAGQLAPPIGLSKERADYQKWLWFSGSWMDQLLWQLRQHDSSGILPADQKDSRVVDRTKAKWIKEIEPQIVAQIEATGNKYLLGEQFTSADVIMGHNLKWSQAYGLCESQVLLDYLARLAERPAWQAAWADAATFGK